MGLDLFSLRGTRLEKILMSQPFAISMFILFVISQQTKKVASFPSFVAGK
jgi:hypothetical protein